MKYSVNHDCQCYSFSLTESFYAACKLKHRAAQKDAQCKSKSFNWQFLSILFSLLHDWQLQKENPVV